MKEQLSVGRLRPAPIRTLYHDVTPRFMFSSPPRFVSSLATLALVTALALPGGALAQTTIYVNDDAGGANDGSQSDPYTALQPALSEAANTSGAVEIRVAGGVYYPDEGSGISAGKRDTSFVLSENLTVKGGYASDFSSRDPAANVTVLSGDIDQDDTTNENGVVTDTSDTAGSNSYHVVQSAELTTATTLEGLTVTAGQANDENPDFSEYTDRGGGIFVDESKLILRNVEIVGNSAFSRGGGIQMRAPSDAVAGSLAVENSMLRKNAGQKGGAVNIGGGALTMTNVTVQNNVGNEGGGIHSSSGKHPVLSNVTFNGNKAIEAGGASRTSGNGGGLYVNGVFGIEKNLVLRSVTFKNNSTEYTGCCDPQGSVGGGAYLNVLAPTLVDLTVRGNTVTEADEGGIYLSVAGTGGVLRNSLFENNQASSPDATNANAGALGVFASEFGGAITVKNTTFRNNSAKTNGGAVSASNAVTFEGVLFRGNSSGENGGGMTISGKGWTLRDVVFRNNTSGEAGINVGGGGLAAEDLGFTEGDFSGRLQNVRFVSNESGTDGGAMMVSGGTYELQNVDFIDNVTGGDFGGEGAALLNDGGMVDLVNAEVRGNDGPGGIVETKGDADDLGTNRLVNVLLTDNGTETAGSGIVLNGSNGVTTMDNVVVTNNGGTGLVNSNTMTVHNSIVYDSEGVSNIDEINNSDTLDVQNTLVRGGLTGDYVNNNGTINDNGGNISGDPQFVDPSNGDYHLQSGSPAVDAGNDSLIPDDSLDLDADGDTSEAVPYDLDLRARTENTVDLGPYELGGAAPEYTASLSSGTADADVPDQFNLDLTFEALATSTDLTLTYDAAATTAGLGLPDNQALAITALWTVTFDPEPAESDVTATACFDLQDLAVAGLDPSKMNVYARSGPDASDWQERTPTALRPSADNAEQVCATGQSSFSQFAVTADAALFDQTPPDPPTTLTADAGTDQVSLSWTASDSTDVAKYYVYRDTSPLGSGFAPGSASPYDSTVVETASDPTTLVDDGATTNETYYYRVTALDRASNESSASNQAQATPGTPSPPTGLTATASTDTITVTWDASPAGDVKRYRLYRDTAPIDSSAGPDSVTPFDSTSSGTTTFVDSTVTAGRTYHYRATVVDTALNESGFSGEAEARAQRPGPAPPTALTASPEGDSTSLEWSASAASDVQTYRIYRDTTPIDSTAGPSAVAVLDSTSAQNTAFVDSSATLGMTYYYRVTAVDSAATESGFSNQASAFLYPEQVTASVDRSFGDASDSSDYRLVALPGQVDQPLREAVSGEAGTDWQAYDDDGSETDFLVPYDRSNDFRFQSGTGFWLTATENWSSTAQQQTVALQGDTAATIPLRAGWNVISNPLGKDVAWAEVEAATPGPLQALFGFDGAFTQVDTFRSAKTGVAYYLFNDDSSRTELVIPYPGAPGTKNATPKGPVSTPRLALTARRADADGPPSSTVEIGLDEDAASGLGPKDLFAPPGRFAATSLRIEPRGKTDSKRTRFLMSEVRRPPTEREGHTFTLRLVSRSEGPIRLSASGLEALNGREAALLHPAAGRSYDLRTQEAIRLPPSGTTTRLKVSLGSKRYVEGKTEAVRPEKVTLTSYPNPMRQQGTLAYALPEAKRVTLRVYDVLGRRVATLAAGRKDAGRHTVRLQTGRLSSGVYFGRLQAGDRTLTQKVTVVR